MNNEKEHDLDEKLKEENPIKYYLKHYGDQKIMMELRLENRELYNKIHRLHYILSMQSKEPVWKCPECNTKTIKLSENRSYEYCTKCGLITRVSIEYAASQKLNIAYGILLI